MRSLKAVVALAPLATELCFPSFIFSSSNAACGLLFHPFLSVAERWDVRSAGPDFCQVISAHCSSPNMLSLRPSFWLFLSFILFISSPVQAAPFSARQVVNPDGSTVVITTTTSQRWVAALLRAHNRSAEAEQRSYSSFQFLVLREQWCRPVRSPSRRRRMRRARTSSCRSASAT